MVSIILPTYNRSAFLQDCIGSVLQQKGADFELIVVDDGSEDDTSEVVAAFGDERIRYYRRPHTGYTSRMKNFAIRRCSGEFLAFIDSDDMWKAGKLDLQLELLAARPDIGFSITDITVFREDTILKEDTYGLRDTVECISIFSRLARNRMLVYNPTLVMRKSCLDRIGLFDESMRSGDHDFNMRLAYHYKAGVIYEPLLMRRLHDSNMSEEMSFENYAEYLSTFERLYQGEMIDRSCVKKARGNAFFKLGELYAGERRWREARKNYFLALKNDLFHGRCYRSLLKSWWPEGRG
jgi:glycosyltransferase involved in cell wall biosynthesis